MKNIFKMGVINITPNSFSDGGEFNSRDSFSKRFGELQKWADIIDIGAESTAPFNRPITEATELERYQKIFYPFLRSHEDPEMTLSIDTYKVNTFREVALFVHRFWPRTTLIFNDISGSIDEELLAFFKEDRPYKFKYVFSHNLSPTRKQALDHMDYCLDESCASIFMDDIERYFKTGIDKIPKGVSVLLDPCFGFSKTREQNHFLLKHFSHLMENLPERYDWIYGISKKSFLRFPKEMEIKNEENQNVLAQIQAILFYTLLENKRTSSALVFRVHDKSAFEAVINVKKIFAL